MKTASLALLTIAVALVSTACGDRLSPTEAVAASAEGFAQIQSFALRFHLATDADEPDSTIEGQIAYQANEVEHSRMSYPDGSETLFIPPDLYVSAPGGPSYVISPWDQGIPRDELPEYGPDDQTIDYPGITDWLFNIEQLPDEPIDDVAYLRYSGTIDLDDPPSDSLSDTIDLGAFGITGRTFDVELWLHKKTYLPHKMHIGASPAGEEPGLITDATFEFFDYDQPITLPEPPDDVRPWRDLQLPEAPCTGTEFTGCLAAQTDLVSISRDSCDGSQTRVCLVPLGRVSPALVEQLVDYYLAQYGLTVTVLTPSAVPEDLADPVREQVDADTLIQHVASLFPDAYFDPGAVLIGLTPVDLYAKDSHFRYVFGVKGTPADPKAMISTFRMSPETYGEPPNDDLLLSRARKLLSKYIGLLFYGLPPSPDPRSPMYDSILGPSDLDNMEEPLPVAPAR